MFFIIIIIIAIDDYSKLTINNNKIVIDCTRVGKQIIVHRYNQTSHHLIFMHVACIIIIMVIWMQVALCPQCSADSECYRRTLAFLQPNLSLLSALLLCGL